MGGDYTILVEGARGVDAGITTVATGLVHTIGPSVSSPVQGTTSGTIATRYPEAPAERSSGRMHGLGRAAPTRVAPEEINRLHRL